MRRPHRLHPPPSGRLLLPARLPARLALLAALLPALLPALLFWAAAPAQAGDPEADYRAAAAAYHRLRAAASPAPSQWRAVAEDFRAVHRLTPRQGRGIDALYSTALAYREAWQTGRVSADQTLAVAHFRDFAERFPQHRLADDALMHLGALLDEGQADRAAARAVYARVVASYPQGDQISDARERIAALEARAQAPRSAPQPAPPPAATVVATVAAAAAPSTPVAPSAPRRQEQDVGAVRKVQFWTTQESTRVIVTTDAGVEFKVNQLEAKPNAPARIYFDLERAVPVETLAARIAVGDGVLEQIRISRYNAHTTRVVLDLGQLERFEVKDYRLADARKIVVDLYPTANRVAEARAREGRLRAAADVRAVQSVVNRPVPEPQVRLPVALQVRSIMIDPGHGGRDPGAVGYGQEEKTLVLEISKRLRDVIRRHHAELRVGLTRETDVFIPLHERPLLAKRFGADLFVSVHLNANTIRRFHGVETYFLNVTNDREALQVAERENASAAQPINEVNGILLDLMRDTTLVESSELAKAVQASLVDTLRTRHAPVRDLGVKQAPFLVLMGAEMPSVLVEAGFVTNRAESERLQDPEYLNRIAEGIYDGLRRYIEQQNVISASRAGEPVAVNARP